MSAELVHTSIARGLDGDSGYTVAGRTGGMPRVMSDALSRLSGLPPAWPGATHGERTMHAFRRVECGGREIAVISRVAPSGMDYTGRENRISHHRVIDERAMAESDPAALLEEDKLWLEEWIGAARELASDALAPALTHDDAPLHAWEKVFGDAGHAASVLAAVRRSGIGLWLVVPSHSRRLRLAAEMASLLPPPERWTLTFATRPISPGGEAGVQICFVDEREPELAARAGSSWILRVGHGALASAPAGTLADRARHGSSPAHADAAARPTGAGERAGRRVAAESAAGESRSAAVAWNAPAKLAAAKAGAATAPAGSAAAPAQDAAAPPIQVWRSDERSASRGVWIWFAGAAAVVAALLWLALRSAPTP